MAYTTADPCKHRLRSASPPRTGSSKPSCNSQDACRPCKRSQSQDGHSHTSSHCSECDVRHNAARRNPRQSPSQHAPVLTQISGQAPHTYTAPQTFHHAQAPYAQPYPNGQASFLQYPIPPLQGPGIMPYRPHPLSQAQPLHDLGFGPTPLFGWASVTPRAHSYGQPKYWKYTRPDYRRFCFSVGKAEVPYASLPGGPLEGFPAHMAPQLVGGRW
jgi:hypothetical protein